MVGQGTARYSRAQSGTARYSAEETYHVRFIFEKQALSQARGYQTPETRKNKIS